MARYVTSLASRLVSIWLPLNGNPPFSLVIDDTQVLRGEDPTATQVELARRDRLIYDKLQTTNIRASLYLVCQHLIVAGDCLWYQTNDYDFRVYRLDQYVVRRDPQGQPHEIILKEWVDVETMDPKVQAAVASLPKNTKHSMGDRLEPMFTQILRVRKGKNVTWSVTREIRGTKIKALSGTHKVCPYRPLTWSLLANEDYGRSLCEENIGDIRSLESFSRSLVEGLAASAEFRFGVNPNGLASIDDLENTENGDFVSAQPNDIFPIQLENAPQVQVAHAAKNDLQRDVAAAFMATSSIQRDAERVTKAEITIMAAQLEQVLGGVVSNLSEDIIGFAVRSTIHKMQKDGLLEPFELGPDKLVKLKIRTGLEALGREIEKSKMEAVAQVMQVLPESAQAAINWSVWMQRWFAAVGIETNGLVRSQEEIAASQAAAMQQQVAMQAADVVTKTAGKVVEQRAKKEQ